MANLKTRQTWKNIWNKLTSQISVSSGAASVTLMCFGNNATQLFVNTNYVYE